MDLDGISDPWETNHFGSLTNANGSTDFDKDGSSDYFEFISGMNPTNPESFFGITNTVILTVSNAALTWPSVSNRTYAIDSCSNLPGGV